MNIELNEQEQSAKAFPQGDDTGCVAGAALQSNVNSSIASQYLLITKIRTDGGTQSRAQLNEEAIADYAEAMSDIMSVELTAIKLLALTTSRNLSTHG